MGRVAPCRHRLAVGIAMLLAVLGWTGPAAAESWGGITPGRTTRKEVEALYGRPTRERTVTEEGRTSPEWTYVGDRTPRGLERMVVTFGLLGPRGFVPDLVRGLILSPKPRVFSRRAIVNGWGEPDGVAKFEQTGRLAFRYSAKGLLIVLDPTGSWAESLTFAPEKPVGASP